jgi:hypothetical protein
MPNAMPVLHSGATEPGWWIDKMARVITPATEVTRMAARAAGATWDGCRPVPIRVGAKSEPPPIPSMPPTQPTAAARIISTGPGGRVACGSGLGNGEPSPERDQDGGDRQVEHVRAGDQLDADDRTGDEHQGQASAGLPAASTGTGRRGGDHVVGQVGRVDRRAGRAQDADLERQQQDCSGDPRRGRRRGDEVGRNDHGPDRPLVFPRRLQADDTHRITGDPDSAWQLPISRRHDPRRRG